MLHLELVFCTKILWDIDPSKGAAKIVEGKVQSAIKYASFSPITNDRVCVSGNGHLSIWDYEQNFHVSCQSSPHINFKESQPYCMEYSKNN